MKRVSIILALTAVMLLAFAGSAFANFGPHGGYALDTDACAGCHRAHTSFSEVTWDSNGTQRSALLVSSAKTATEFCYACHGNDAPGASTNVEAGLFDAGPSGANTVPLGGGILYETESTFNGGLNGGAFTGVTSMHDMDKGAVTDPMWGAGSSAPAGKNLSCTSCHDVHGSSNYRLLKDTVEGVPVGGYNASDTPTPIVVSYETNYPVGGWLKHTPGAAQMAAYRPNYTEPKYKILLGGGGAAGPNRSMSTWCSTCHAAYNDKTSAYDYGAYESNGAISRDGFGQLTVTGATQAVGSRVRHRHPVDSTVVSANTVSAGFGTNAIVDSLLPLQRTTSTEGNAADSVQDYLGCLTCHRAHGSSAVMTGWANARLVNRATIPTWSVEPTTALPAGVNPNVSSAILRVNNRGVCERCHNK